MTTKITCGLVPFANVVDRFLPEGYRDGMEFEAALEASKDIKGLDAIALDYPMQFDDPRKMKATLDDHGVQLSLLEVGIYGERRWKNGSFAATDPGIRREAVEVTKRCMDAAAQMGVDEILLWPGQDGFEYPFQTDYAKAWRWLVDGIGEAVSHRSDVRVAIEYKAKEPRVRCLVDSVGKALLLSEKIGLPNVGICVDIGHAFNALENPAYSVALAAEYGRLFEVHVNDNYGDWDSDMLVGQINFWTTLEYFYWLNKIGWDRWYVMDFFPYREDGPKALEQMIRNTQRLISIAGRLSRRPLEEMQAAGDPLAISEMLWNDVIKFED